MSNALSCLHVGHNIMNCNSLKRSTELSRWCYLQPCPLRIR